jgi:hypothetical protein
MDRRRGRRASFTFAAAAVVCLLGAGRAEAARLTSLQMEGDPGDWVGDGQTYDYETDDGTFTVQRNELAGISITFLAPGVTDFWHLDFAAALNVPLTTGVYADATRYLQIRSDVPTFEVVGNGHGCNELDGEFEVLEVAYDESGGVTAFRARFVQHCEHGLVALRGEIRYQADVQVEMSAPRRVVGPVGEVLEVPVGGVPVEAGPVTLTASGTPVGAVFTDMGDGTGRLVWMPGADQTGEYHVSFFGRTTGAADRVDTTLFVGTTVHVPADRPTIQAAIDEALPGSRIIVAPGTYQENLDFLGKPVRLESESGPDVTIVDGGGAREPVVRFWNVEGRDSVLSGFTLRNGYPDFYFPYFGLGGGISMFSASPTITGNVITGNFACEGAGIGMMDSSARIEGNRIVKNAQKGCSGGAGGGGISLQFDGESEIVGNLIADNVTYSLGGGISASWTKRILISNNSVLRNYGERGGGLDVEGVDLALIDGNVVAGNRAYDTGGVLVLWPAALVNNTIAGNEATEYHPYSGVYVRGPVEPYDYPVMINNIIVGVPGQTAVTCEYTEPVWDNFNTNDVFNPGGPVYGGTCDLSGTNGNVSIDPAFQCAALDDYRPGPGATVIDAGRDVLFTPDDRDLSDTTRVLDGDRDGEARLDMGALELDPAAPLNPCIYAFCPADMEVRATSGQSTAVLTFDPATGPPGATVTCQPASGSRLPAGTHTVTCTSVHPTRGTASCSFQVRAIVPPVNDDRWFAKAIPVLPFVDRLDTRVATPGVDDQTCSGQYGTVWYSFTAPRDLIVVADTAGSSYVAGIAVMSLQTYPFVQRMCGAGPLTVSMRAGETLHFLVGSSQGGGDLVFSLTGRLPLSLRLSIDRTLSSGPDPGSVRIGGRAECLRPSSLTLTGSATPDDGGGPVTFTSQVQCGNRSQWEAVIPQAAERFAAGGRIEMRVSGEAVEAATGDRADATASSRARVKPENRRRAASAK